LDVRWTQYYGLLFPRKDKSTTKGSGRTYNGVDASDTQKCGTEMYIMGSVGTHESWKPGAKTDAWLDAHLLFCSFLLRPLVILMVPKYVVWQARTSNVLYQVPHMDTLVCINFLSIADNWSEIRHMWVREDPKFIQPFLCVTTCKCNLLYVDRLLPLYFEALRCNPSYTSFTGSSGGFIFWICVSHKYMVSSQCFWQHASSVFDSPLSVYPVHYSRKSYKRTTAPLHY
jgi:hypothetical protein